MHAHAFRFLQELATQSPVALTIAGDCMEPLLARGASVAVRRKRVYLPGDVVVFRTQANDVVAHRVLGYRTIDGRAALVTKGDRCVIHDAPVYAEDIIGAVVDMTIDVQSRVKAIAQLGRIILRKR